MKLNKFKMGLLSSLFILFLYSCEVEHLEPSNPIPDVEETTPPSDTIPSENIEEEPNPNEGKPSDQNTIVIGNGSGYLSLKDASNKNYSIKPGTYSGMSLSNIQNTTIDGLENVKIKGGNIDISNVNGLTLNAISIEDYSQAAIYIHTSANNLILKNIKLKNISNYGIRFDVNRKYDGSKESYSENILLDNIQAENIGTLFISKGSIENDGFYGLIKRFKITNSKVINSPYLNGLTSLGLGEDYEMSNNTVNNVNASDNYPNGSNNHTAIFYALGNGKIFNNKVTNHQGNVVRAWLFSITKQATVEIHNNIVYNSTRYGAFELQVPPSIENMQSFKPANAKVYNNTVGKLNTGQPKFFEGRLLDLYETYGNVEIYNNLSFDNRDDILINNMSNPKDTKIIKNANNRYFKNSSDAVSDLINFKSKISGVGAR